MTKTTMPNLAKLAVDPYRLSDAEIDSLIACWVGGTPMSPESTDKLVQGLAARLKATLTGKAWVDPGQVEQLAERFYAIAGDGPWGILATGVKGRIKNGIYVVIRHLNAGVSAPGQNADAAASTPGASPDDIRAAGWAVAVHNDYRLNGEAHTFWLFTKGDIAVKGEGRTDADALDQVRGKVGLPAPAEGA